MNKLPLPLDFELCCSSLSVLWCYCRCNPVLASLQISFWLFTLEHSLINQQLFKIENVALHLRSIQTLSSWFLIFSFINLNDTSAWELYSFINTYCCLCLGFFHCLGSPSTLDGNIDSFSGFASSSNIELLLISWIEKILHSTSATFLDQPEYCSSWINLEMLLITSLDLLIPIARAFEIDLA